MSELTVFTGSESFALEELPPDIAVEEALVVTGALYGLAHDESRRLTQLPRKTAAELVASYEATMAVIAIWEYAENARNLVRKAVPDNDSLHRLVTDVGLDTDPRLVIDVEQSAFLRLNTKTLFKAD